MRITGGAPMVFLGRWDDQVQVLGHRVELSEVEAALRGCAGIVDAAAIAWPVQEGTAQGIVAFVTGDAEGHASVIE